MAQANLSVLKEKTAGFADMVMRFLFPSQIKDTKSYVESHAKCFLDFQPPEVRLKKLNRLWRTQKKLLKNIKNLNLYSHIVMVMKQL